MAGKENVIHGRVAQDLNIWDIFDQVALSAPLCFPSLLPVIFIVLDDELCPVWTLRLAFFIDCLQY